MDQKLKKPLTVKAIARLTSRWLCTFKHTVNNWNENQQYHTSLVYNICIMVDMSFVTSQAKQHIYIKKKKTFLERIARGCCGARTLSHSSWLPFTLQPRWLAISRGWTLLNPAEPCEPCCSADPESSPSSCDDVAIKRFPSVDQRDALHSFVRLSAIGPKHKCVYLHKADPSLACPRAAVLGVRARWTGSLQQLQQ